MSSLPMPIPSVLDARTQAFPVLTAAQISRIRSVSQLREVKKGEILFEPDDTNVPFFVLLSGSMEIVQPDLTGERPIATHGPGGFTGEMTMISGRRSLARGRVTESGSFWPGMNTLIRTSISTRTRLHRNFSIVLTSSWTKFRWSFAALAPCCGIPRFRN